MSPQPFAEYLLSPLPIAVLFVIVGLSTGLLRIFLPRASLSIGLARIARGYVALVLAMVVTGWLIDFFSGDAARVASIFLAYAGVLLMAILGVPIIIFLTSRDYGSIAWCLVGSLVISLVLTPAYFSMGSLVSRTFTGWVSHIFTIATLSCLAMLAFCLGARIPWRRVSSSSA